MSVKIFRISDQFEDYVNESTQNNTEPLLFRDDHNNTEKHVI